MHEEIKQLIIELMSKGNFDVEDIIIDNENSIDGIWYIIKTPNSRHLIGKNGETLDSINYLVKKIIEQKYPDVKGVVIDVDNFKKSKVENLKTTAHMYAERAKFFKSQVQVDPMNSFERRIIHLHLEKYPNIITESAGEGKNRHVIIKYIEN